LDHGYYKFTDDGELSTADSHSAKGFLRQSSPPEEVIKPAGNQNSISPSESVSEVPMPELDAPRDNSYPSVVSLQFGDIISIGDLLRLSDPYARDGEMVLDSLHAPQDDNDGNAETRDFTKQAKRVSENETKEENLRHLGQEAPTTLRYQGGILVVNIQYMNTAPWDYLATAPVRYVISSSLMPQDKFKQMYKDEGGSGMRTVNNVHGLLIEARVRGKIREFRFSALLTTITTALALLAAPVSVTDAVMLYVLEDKDKFTILKYQPTQDFSELRALQTAQKMETEARGAKYDEVEQKPTPDGDFLSDIFERFRNAHWNPDMLVDVDRSLIEQSQSRLCGGQPRSWLLDTLAVMIRHEQRLNRVDGMDEHNLRTDSPDKMAAFYKTWSKHYWMRSGYRSSDILDNGFSPAQQSNPRGAQYAYHPLLNPVELQTRPGIVTPPVSRKTISPEKREKGDFNGMINNGMGQKRQQESQCLGIC
jgi:hypothetical protein